MKIFIFKRTADGFICFANIQEDASSEEGSLWPKDLSLDDFASINRLRRHHAFDWAVGNAGQSCALMEWVDTQEKDIKDHIHMGKTALPLQWLDFHNLIKSLTIGNHRRLAQLMVQYIVADGIPNDLYAVQ